MDSAVLKTTYLGIRRMCIHKRLCSTLKCHTESRDSLTEDKSREKILKVAIIGPPNAGKSTIINSLIGRNVCSASSKVHTTRHKIRAISVEGNTQLIFVDTPGLVSGNEMRKFKLEKTFMSNPEDAVLEADTIGVVHDASNKWCANALDPKTLRLLKLYSSKRSFLILNKIDVVKKKYALINMVDVLTNKTLNQQFNEHSHEEDKISEMVLKKIVKEQQGWSRFEEVFMVSALTGDGLGDVKEFLLQQAKPGPWLYESEQFTDERPEDIILQSVQSKLLENLPHEIPYHVKTQMEYFKVHPDGRIVSVVLVNCPSPRLGKLVVGPKGKRIKVIAQQAEQEIRNTFHENVFLKLVVSNSSSERETVRF